MRQDTDWDQSREYLHDEFADKPKAGLTMMWSHILRRKNLPRFIWSKPGDCARFDGGLGKKLGSVQCRQEVNRKVRSRSIKHRTTRKVGGIYTWSYYSIAVCWCKQVNSHCQLGPHRSLSGLRLAKVSFFFAKQVQHYFLEGGYYFGLDKIVLRYKRTGPYATIS